MLGIRQPQLEAFRDVANGIFAERMADFIRARLPEVTLQLGEERATIAALSRQRLRALVEHAIREAHGHDLFWETSVALFVVLMFVVSPTFFQHQAVKELLQNSTIPKEERVNWICENFSEDVWSVVKADAPSETWLRVLNSAEEGGV